MTETFDDACEIHAFTSTKDWLNLIWGLKSFYRVSRRQYAVCIHDDGTLSPQQFHLLQVHFPHARIIPRNEADRRMEVHLAPYPHAARFRKSNPLAPKLLDFNAFLEADRMLLFDSDLLFFAYPEALITHVEDSQYRHNVFNGDIETSYSVSIATAERCGHPLMPRINSGLGLVRRGSVSLDAIERYLQLPGLTEGKVWLVEQTLYALSSSAFGVQLLPAEYDVRLTGGIGGRPVKHYVGAVRHLMYSEGIPRLVKDGLLGR